MKTLNNLNLAAVAVFMVLAIIGFGFMRETFMYLAIYAACIIACLQTLGVLIWLAVKGNNAYLIAYLIFATLTLFTRDSIIFFLVPIAILYITVVLHIKVKSHEP